METVKLGTTFRWHYADGNSLWRVTKKRGVDTWEATIVNEPFEIDGQFYDSDYVGTVKVFGTEEIERQLHFAQQWQELVDEANAWWDAQPLGTTIHYHNGFDEYVRGEVVLFEDQNGDFIKGLKPLALVGNWRHLRPPAEDEVDGYFVYPHHVKKIMEESPWRPSKSCVWEASESLQNRAKIDPTTETPIDLTPWTSRKGVIR